MHVARADDDDDADAGAGKPKKPVPTWDDVNLSLVLPIITDKGLTQQVSLMVTIRVPYGKGDEIKAMAPKLSDAYISDLYGALGSGTAMMKGGVLDVAAIKQRLSDDTTKVLGPDKVVEVLLPVVDQSKR